MHIERNYQFAILFERNDMLASMHPSWFCPMFEEDERCIGVAIAELGSCILGGLPQTKQPVHCLQQCAP